MKYKNKPVDGFDSKKERDRYRELAILEQIGKISNLKYHVRYELIPKQEGERACHYEADFVFTEGGKTVVEDTKGFKTPDYIIKRKLMLLRHGIKIREV